MANSCTLPVPWGEEQTAGGECLQQVGDVSAPLWPVMRSQPGLLITLLTFSKDPQDTYAAHLLGPISNPLHSFVGTKPLVGKGW